MASPNPASASGLAFSVNTVAAWIGLVALVLVLLLVLHKLFIANC
jgi:hypothetical protein